MQELIIRPVQQDELFKIMSIEEQSSCMWKQSYFEQELENSFSYFYAAEINDKIIGFIVGWLVADQFEILNIAVAPAYRRKGIAARLIDYLITKSTKTFIQKVLLEVKETNLAALEFYRAQGFMQTGIRKNYYRTGDHAILMERHRDNEL